MPKWKADGTRIYNDETNDSILVAEGQQQIALDVLNTYADHVLAIRQTVDRAKRKFRDGFEYLSEINTLDVD